MSTYLIIGNIFSLLSSICIAVSVVKKNKHDLIYWQIGNTLFAMVTNLVLCAYAALVISFICFVRNILFCKGKLTKNITLILLIINVIVGLYVNNLQMIGLLAIIASASYTICIYTTKNEQQMRWALVFNLILWFIHDIYIQAYPSAITEFILTCWTALQIFRNRKK